MSRRLGENGKALALALAVAAPMAYVLQISMGIYLPAWHVLLYSAVSLLLIELIGWNRVTAIAVPAGLVLLCGYLWLVFGKEQRQPFIDFYWWAVDFLYTGENYPLGHGMALTAITTFLVSLYIWLFGRKFFCFPAVLALTVGFILFKWLQGLDNVLMPGMLACGGLMLLWAKSFQRKTAKQAGSDTPENGIALYLLPIALAIVLISMVSVPEATARKWQNRQVYDMFERVNNYLADYTDFNRPRNTFSISRFGFMPMGNRLGGPTNLSDVEVLHVAAPRRMLLRGTVYNEYDGSRWLDSTGSQQKRLTESNRAALDNAFDRNRPEPGSEAAALIAGFTEPVVLQINPVLNSASTLFVPYRGVTGATSDKFLAVLPRFNAKGEVFSSSDVHAGYSYKITADYLHYGAMGFGDAMDRMLSAGLSDPFEQSTWVRQNFLALPENIEQSVYDITNEVHIINAVTRSYADAELNFVTITDNKLYLHFADRLMSISDYDEYVELAKPAENDWQKALAIQEFLSSKNFRYTLTPEEPFQNIDFVSWFVNHDRQGYCTYFASAMAVMARIAGIPSRYCEGYMMPDTAESGQYYIIRGNNAHAWAELYFEGIGWIPFDATPSGEASEGTGTGDSGADIPYLLPTRPPVEPEGGDIGVLPARNTITWKNIAPYLWTLPAAAAAFALIWAIGMMIRARVRVSLRRVTKRYADRKHRCAFYYFELLQLLEYYNYPVKTGETPFAYAARIDRWLRLLAGTFQQAARLISLISYSDYPPTDEDVAFMATMLRELTQYTYHTVGPWFYLWRRVFGFKQLTTHRPADH